METHRSIHSLSTLPGPIHLAIGVFDGIHLGHQEVIRQASQAAEATDGTAVVATFDPHPLRVLRPESVPRILTSTRHKEIILERLGIRHLLEIAFTAEFAALSAESFVALLHKHCQPLGSISVGHDWAFGCERSGTVATLKQFGLRDGFSVVAVPLLQIAGDPVSSTRIRQVVEAGDFIAARSLLGRDYSVLGTVVHGRKLGRKLGFPTANLDSLTEQLPPVGVYAVRVAMGCEILPGVANLGFRPTLNEGVSQRQLEVHLFDFDGDVYGQEMEVRFVQRLRDELRLPSLEALKEQISRDCNSARLILGADAPQYAAACDEADDS
ncbi:MAG: bifunctional riboflavin kinase/FAD synthetase [Verrucomicrobiales bacterium]|nr:bifunctional riboflavin kinase/FAD synthetase [Verrucomicrobiales bacterium]